MLERFTGRSSDTKSVPVYLLRHADAGRRDRWTEADELRPVTPSGRRQCERVVAWFDGRPLRRLLSSPFLRCVQTLEPLAEARRLEIELVDELAEGHPVAAVETFVLAVAADGPAVLCTHGEVQRSLVEALIRTGTRVAGGAVGFEKGSTWILDVSDGEVTALRHVRPA